jgi:hypothetical protein
MCVPCGTRGLGGAGGIGEGGGDCAMQTHSDWGYMQTPLLAPLELNVSVALMVLK